MNQPTNLRYRLPDVNETSSIYEVSIEKPRESNEVKITIFSISIESQTVLESNSTHLPIPCKLEQLSGFINETRSEFETFKTLNDKHMVYLFNVLDNESVQLTTFGKVLIDGGWWLTINGCPTERFMSESNIDAIMQQEKRLEALISNAELVVKQLRSSGFAQQDLQSTAAKYWLINAISNARQNVAAPTRNESYAGQLYTYKSN